ncbi:MAG TPA: hypothetical protein PKJ54_02920 [Candidatus Pacearchaeota archaeon]|jgi:hypothetical protein|nr:hypothetical protein [Candidatus Pacearchaeota archaeon]
MKKEKRLKKFNISNRLAYTLMVILSIVLLGIGVWAAAPNPGHSANELELDWGEKSFCEGTPNSCDSYPQSSCTTQKGCSVGCGGEGGEVTCNIWSSESDCNDHGCNWDHGSHSCSGYSDGGYVACYYFSSPRTECLKYQSLGCYWGCTGTATPCSYFNNKNDCDGSNGQKGCKWVTRQRSIIPTNKGINISSIITNAICDASGTRCLSVRTGALPSSEAQVYQGRDSARREMRRDASVSCPEGSYLTRVQVVDLGVGHEAYLKGTCKALPIR